MNLQSFPINKPFTGWCSASGMRADRYHPSNHSSLVIPVTATANPSISWQNKLKRNKAIYWTKMVIYTNFESLSFCANSVFWFSFPIETYMYCVYSVVYKCYIPVSFLLNITPHPGCLSTHEQTGNKILRLVPFDLNWEILLLWENHFPTMIFPYHVQKFSNHPPGVYMY